MTEDLKKSTTSYEEDVDEFENKTISVALLKTPSKVDEAPPPEGIDVQDLE